MKAKILLIIIICVSVYNTSCKKEKHNADCGCNAPTRVTIPDSTSLIGTIQYNTMAFQGYNSYKNKYLIGYTEPDCGNCVHIMVVCNNSILPQQVLNLKNDINQSLTVKLAGHLKPICDKVFAPADYTYENILLTKIEVQ
ncbi:MAG: hypothetical protein M9887_02640 [Chitinophagales bacterium]|nr:hypothetical protein [Chitinophagales bacterium]